MYWALTTDLVDTRGYEFEQVLGGIQTLNQWARCGRLEVTAISLAAYPFVQEDYALLPHGASIGSGYGPIVVAREELTLAELRELEIVVPGTMTTPRRSKSQATAPFVPRLPSCLANVCLTSAAVRFRLSVSASTKTATPPSP